jgi:microsomal dipeptidase-like Zn-dependent dipeptidase
MPFFDFHIHPALKSLFSGGSAQNGYTALSPWTSIDQSKIPFLLNWCSDFQYILATQGNLEQLADTGVNLICVALYMPEMDMLKASLIQDATKGSLKVYLDANRLTELINGNPFQILINQQWVTLTNATVFGIKGKSLKPLNDSKDFAPLDTNTIQAVFSVEGCHTLSSKLQTFDLTDILGNLDKLRAMAKVISLNLTHMEQSPICNHAFGMQFLSDDGFKPTGFGISEAGVQIIQHCYQNHIMIDLKHMSLGARQQLYLLRQNAAYVPIAQPLICTHAGFTGISWADIHKYVFQERPFSKGYTVLWQGKPVGYGNEPRPSFNASSINLYDEDILEILRSGGMIGLSMDQRILGFQEYENEVNGRDDYPMETEYISNQERSVFYGNGASVVLGEAFENDGVLGWEEIEQAGVVGQDLSYYHLHHVMNHVLHLITIAGRNGYDITLALTQICIGSDFDGLIDPISTCLTTPNLPGLKQAFTDNFITYANLAKVVLPQGFTINQFADNLFFENGKNFVLKRLDVLNG